jgi:hypothetical protein
METTTPITTAADKAHPEAAPATSVPQLPTHHELVPGLKENWMAARLRIHDVSLLMKHVSKEDSLLSFIKKPGPCGSYTMALNP